MLVEIGKNPCMPSHCKAHSLCTSFLFCRVIDDPWTADAFLLHQMDVDSMYKDDMEVQDKRGRMYNGFAVIQ
jgi:hypothetical protein